jgi:hypothetical protein
MTVRPVRLGTLTALAAAIAVITPARAAAPGARTIAPPGNSAVAQYLESIPGANGARPTNTIRPGGRRNPNTVGSATERAFAGEGVDGLSAVALARATAPAAAGTGLRPTARAHSRQEHAPLLPAGAIAADPPSGSGRDGGSAAGAVTKALSGSSTGDGLGPLLPAVLIVTTIGGAAFGLRRRRRAR